MAVINHDDIVGKGNPLKELEAALERTKTDFKIIVDYAKTLKKEIKSTKFTGAGDGDALKKQALQIEKLKKAIDGLKLAKKSEAQQEINLEKLKQQKIRTQQSELRLSEQLRKKKNRETNELKKQSSAYFQLTKRLNDARQKAKDLGAEFGRTSRQFKKAQKEANKLDRQVKKLDKSVGQNQRNVGNYGKAVGAVVGKFALWATAIMGVFRALKSTFNIVVNFQKSVSKLGAISQASSKELKKLSKQARELGSATKFTATEIIELDTELAKLGFTANQIYDAVPGIQALAAATGIELARSAEIAGSALNIFGLEAKEAGRVADVLAVSTTKSALDMEKLATALPYVGTSARLFGKDIEWTTARLGTLVDRGMEASTAGTSMRKMFGELTKKGISYEDALQQINNSSNKAKTALDLFGLKAKDAAIILAENIVQTNGLEKALTDLDVTAKQMADTMQDNLAGDITKAGSAWEGFILSLENGDGVLAKTIRSIVQLWTEFLNLITVTNEDQATKNFNKFKASLKDTDNAAEKVTKRIAELMRQQKKLGTEIDDVKDKIAKGSVQHLRIYGNELAKINEKGELAGKEIKLLNEYLTELNKTQKESSEPTTSGTDPIEEQIINIKYLRKVVSELQAEKELIAGTDEEAIKQKNRQIATINEEIARLDALIDKQKEFTGIRVQGNEQILASTAKLRESTVSYEQEQLNAFEKLAEFSIKYADEINAAYSGISSGLESLGNIFQAQENKKQAALKRRLDAGLIDKETYEKESEKLQKESAKKQQKIASGQAVIKGALSILEITTAWADAPPIAAALIAMQVALTASQIAAINSQSFGDGGTIVEAGSHASGNDMQVFGVTKDGKTQSLGNVEGGELMQVFSKDDTNGILAGDYSNDRAVSIMHNNTFEAAQLHKNNELLSEIVDAIKMQEIGVKDGSRIIWKSAKSLNIQRLKN